MAATAGIVFSMAAIVYSLRQAVAGSGCMVDTINMAAPRRMVATATVCNELAVAVAMTKVLPAAAIIAGPLLIMVLRMMTFGPGR